MNEQDFDTHIYNGQFGNIDALTKRAYTSTGFDLLGALMRVSTRPNPKITIGPVDLSCSFTVVDAKHPDQPIVHCSDTFCELTGYDRTEIIGRNCRFLQSPDGLVEAGSERMHTDNGAVAHIKKHCSRFQECQTSLINYRRDGSPFINLVTIIPSAGATATSPCSSLDSRSIWSSSLVPCWSASLMASTSSTTVSKRPTKPALSSLLGKRR
ncbi:hypothetical protein L7F22_055372 [Adiantum nelumboides]|nr:hypothetical protein [Adiantum nelumboides]